VSHLPVDPRFRGRNGKVNAVLTGLHAASHDAVILADDDVRYDADGLHAVARLLAEGADLVRPQNYFDPLPWHARWDTARTLVNRALGHDYPGTLGVRRPALASGYDADVLFENLELIRTVEVTGGRVANARGLYVRRLPPTTRQFGNQRVRQAYDSFAQPGRLATELALLPLILRWAFRRRFGVLSAATVGVVALAEVGRRRDGGAVVFRASCSLLAPLWVGERAVCAWAAVWLRLRRDGVTYAGEHIATAASSKRTLRRRLRRQG
jgi:hypothetical protein